MSPQHDHRTLVHHRAALGDTILIWPLLRALRAGNRSGVTLASDASKARLASRILGIDALDAETPAIRDLWRDSTPPFKEAFARVIWFGPPAEAQSVERFERNLRASFGASEVHLIHTRPDRTTAPKLIGMLGLTEVPITAQRNRTGPVVLHVGAGSETKRWPMERWCAAAGELIRLGRPVSLIAGEVEIERLDAKDRARFIAAGGKFLDTLDALADALAGASVVVAGDTGPGHLAAQLGVPTLSLFGPTDPARWAPVGPAARVLAPKAPTPMTWITPDIVIHHTLKRIAER